MKAYRQTTFYILFHFTVASVDVELSDGSSVYVSMLPNPSHLEAVNPVALGKARARQLTLRDGPYSQGPDPADPTPSSRVLSLQVLTNNIRISRSVGIIILQPCPHAHSPGFS
jgi:hypothetical protein